MVAAYSGGSVNQMTHGRTGDPKDFLKRSELYADFRSQIEEERDRKTAIGKQKFFHKLLLELGEDDYKQRHQRGKTQARDVFVCWSYNSESSG